jgi:dihydroflavonol-4-reductase
MKKVLVTGANGHLGYHLVQALRQRGYQVRAGVRHAGDAARNAPLNALGAEVVRAELLDAGSLNKAMTGMDGLFQNAAMYRFTKGRDAEMLETSLKGGENALRAAGSAGVRRVVYTSSCLSAGCSRKGEPPRSEADWAGDSALPYVRAKADGERHAREFARRENLPLVSVLPGIILGPGFHRHTPSTIVIEQIQRNRIPAAPTIYMCPVDARDVAAAMVAAYERDGAGERYLLTADTLAAHDVAAQMRDIDPAVKVPGRMPDLFRPLVPYIDALNAKLTGQPHLLTREFMADIGNAEPRYDSSRARAELGWRPRPLADTLRDTMDWIRSHELSSAGV